MQNFEQIRAHIQTTDFRIKSQEPYMICIELSLVEGQRQQAIFLTELVNEDQRRFLRVSTAVTPIDGSLDLMRPLVFNWQSRVGYLAVSELDGTPYLQLCENRPYEGLSAAEIERLIIELGGLGDYMEQKLSIERDVL